MESIIMKKTNRRGFFKQLAGIGAAGIAARLIPQSKSISVKKPNDLYIEIDSSKVEPELEKLMYELIEEVMIKASNESGLWLL